MSLLLALTGGGGGAYTLTANAGSYSLSGQDASLRKSHLLVGAAGSYALTGVAAGLSKSYKLTALAGAYVYTGNAAAVIYTPIAGAYVLTANAGAYTVSGVAAGVARSKRVVGAAGAYALTGVAANVAKSKRVLGNSGTYLLAGNAANIVYTPTSNAYTLTAASGSYAVSGKDAGIVHTVSAPSYSGEVTLTRKRIYIKRGKQYLIFNNNEEADAYLVAEEAIEAAKKSSRGAAKRKIKALKVVKPEIVAEPKLDELSLLLAKFNVNYDLLELQKNNDIEALYHIQSMLYEMQQDEEDIELLLMAAYS